MDGGDLRLQRCTEASPGVDERNEHAPQRPCQRSGMSALPSKREESMIKRAKDGNGVVVIDLTLSDEDV